MTNVSDALLVSLANDILVVGMKLPNQAVTIVNAFQGEEAIELYKKLVGEKGNNNAEVS